MSEVNQQIQEKPNSFAKWIGRGIAVILLIVAVIIGIVSFGETSLSSTNNTSQEI